MKRRQSVLLLVLLLHSTRALTAQTRHLNVGDAVINYEIAGAGRTIVFIHGWAQDLSAWDDQVKAFSGSYRVIRYDVRGFGESTGFADKTADADDLRILLDSLGIRSASIVGLSRGAEAALNFAVAFPKRVDALVLYGAPPPAGFQPLPARGDPMERFARIAQTAGLDSLGRIVYASPNVWRPDSLTPDQRVAHAQRFQAAWKRYKGRDLLDPRPPSGRVAVTRIEQVNGITQPTLVINGDHETPLLQLVADTLVQRIPHARKVVIANGGHGAHLDNPGDFNAALMSFLKDAASSRGAPRKTGRINVGDAIINYELSGQGKTVVLIHGWANTLHIWDDQAPFFSQRYQVLRYDRRGFGQSTGFADISADPDDLRILLDSLGIASAYVVGLSAGSDVATRFAVAFPKRIDALVRVSGSPPEGFPVAPFGPQLTPRRIAQQYGMDSLGKVVYDLLVWRPPGQTEAERRRQKEDFDKRWAEYPGRDLLDPHPASGRVPAAKWDTIDQLHVPTLLVNGEHDMPMQLLVADSLARRIPGAQKVVIADAAHAANLHQAALFNQLVANFFAHLAAR